MKRSRGSSWTRGGLSFINLPFTSSSSLMQFWWIGIIAAIVCDLVDASLHRSVITLYDDNSCSSPASVMIFPNEDCDEQSGDHYAQECVDNGVSYSESDCEFYYLGGTDFYGLIPRAFGDNVSYLVVEEYFMTSSGCEFDASVWWGYGLGDTTIYRLDEDCHSNRNGTTSSKLTLDKNLTLTKYNDADCSSVLSETTVTWETASQGQCVDNNKYFLEGAKPAMATVAVFDDITCSTPSMITFTQHFGCSTKLDPATSVCGPNGPTKYSISSCTNDYSELVDTMFGFNTPYLVVEKHSHSNCGSLQSVTVYAADSSCHTNVDDGTSVRVVLDADGSGTIRSYADAYCSLITGEFEVTKQNVLWYSCLPDSGCNSVDGSCTKRYSIGGFGGPSAKGEMTAVAVYGGNPCSQPAATLTFTRELFCVPQVNPLQPSCENIDGVFSFSDCAVYSVGWDSNGLFDLALGSTSYLLVEEFDTSLGGCGDSNATAGATAYHLDDECYPNHDSTASTKIIFGYSLIIAKYDDPFCTTLSSEMEVTWDTAHYGRCIGGNTRFIFRNSWPELTTIAVFDDEGCSEKPVKLTFTPLFGCSVSNDPVKSVCGLDGSSHYSVSSCQSDYNGFATNAFGSTTPYLVVEEFTGYWCENLQNVVVYIADDSCHTNTDDTTSFIATITKEGSASITTYLDASCTTIDRSTNLTKRQLIASSTCYNSNDLGDEGDLYSTRISYGGLGGPPSQGLMTSVAVYGPEFCSRPARMVTFTRELVCSPDPHWYWNYWQPSCQYNGGLFYENDCTNYWSGEFMTRVLPWSSLYLSLLVEEYDTSLGNCGVDNALDNATAYLLDEECHVNYGGNTSTQLTVGYTVTITKYDDPQCTIMSSQTQVSWRNARRSSCTASGNKRFSLRGPMPALTAVTVFDDNSCSGKPVKLTVSQDFVCGATLHPEKATCGADGSTLYSVSNCTGDYSGLADTVFGMEFPYIMLEEFDDFGCNQVQNVTVYTADNVCHSNTDEASSFTATITPEGSATLTTYSDIVCGIVENNITWSRRVLASYTCTQENGECLNEDGYSYSKRISVGGLGGSRSKGRMTSVVSYGNTSCTPPASTVAFTRDLACTPQNNRYSPTCEDNGTVSFTTDCVDYNYRGGPFWFPWPSLGFSPNILVEEYDGPCGLVSNLDNATIYQLDEECHPNREETRSSRLTLGFSLTITEYDDPNCNAVSMTREVSFMQAMNQECVDDRVIAYLRGGIPDLTAVAIYGDDSCSGSPVKITFTQYFKCDVPTSALCEQVSDKRYSVSSCTRDYFGVTFNGFGNQSRYVMVEAFSDGHCGWVQNVTVYAADGACHSNIDGTSFRATIGSDNSATVTTYIDASCKKIEDNTKVRWEILSYACIRNYECAGAYRYGCSKRFSVGGLGGSPSLGKMTGIVTYEDSSCSQPEGVTLTRDLVCTSKTDTDKAVCEASGTMYSVSQCVDVTNSSNSYQFLDEIFGWRSHLVVEDYDTSLGNCGDQNALAGVTGYLLDENCHDNSLDGGSYKLTFGISLFITVYNDVSCSSELSETEVTWDMVRYGLCFGGTTRYYLRGPMPDLTAVALFDDKKCSEAPVKITLSQLFGCNADTGSKFVCGSDGSGLYSISSCISDYTAFAANTFGNETPYLVEEKFSDSWCGHLETVTVYVADGSCHTNTDDTTSFMAMIAVNGWASVVTYNDANCGSPNTSTNVNVGNETHTTTCLSGSVCVNADGSECSKKFTVGGLGGSQSSSSKAVTVYDDSSCAGIPVQLVVTNQLACSPPKSSACNEVLKGRNTMYQDHTCIDDVSAFAASTFSKTPYLLVENFVNGTNCEKQQGAVVYKADGACYNNIIDSRSFRIVPNVGGSVTIANYPRPSCKDSDADYTTIGAKYISTNECFQGSSRIYANMTGLLTTTAETPSTDIDYKVREEIMFPEWLWEPTPRRIFVSS